MMNFDSVGEWMLKLLRVDGIVTGKKRTAIARQLKLAYLAGAASGRKQGRAHGKRIGFRLGVLSARKQIKAHSETIPLVEKT